MGSRRERLTRPDACQAAPVRYLFLFPHVSPRDVCGVPNTGRGETTILSSINIRKRSTAHRAHGSCTLRSIPGRAQDSAIQIQPVSLAAVFRRRASSRAHRRKVVLCPPQTAAPSLGTSRSACPLRHFTSTAARRHRLACLLLETGLQQLSLSSKLRTWKPWRREARRRGGEILSALPLSIRSFVVLVSALQPPSERHGTFMRHPPPLWVNTFVDLVSALRLQQSAMELL